MTPLLADLAGDEGAGSAVADEERPAGNVAGTQSAEPADSAERSEPAEGTGSTSCAPGTPNPPGTPASKIVARLYGEPLVRLPQDLYIPPDALEIFLDAFEGPLDVLLYLIRKQNFDILDIPMAEVTRQYLRYVEEIRDHNLEMAGDYLLMAAMLIDIKSRMLLPVHKADSGEPVEDPRAELARRLIEYERIKLGAQRIDQLPQLGRDFLAAQAWLERPVTVRLPDVTPADLAEAWAQVLRRARLVQHHRVTREELSVREYMTMVLRKLQNRRFAEFEELFDSGQGIAAAVVTFIALLELARESLVEITQAEAFAPIYVRLAYVPS